MTTIEAKKELSAALQAISAYAQAIMEAKQIPNGHLYAVTSATGVSLEAHNRIIQILKDAGLVAETNYMLRWVGPAIQIVNSQN